MQKFNWDRLRRSKSSPPPSSGSASRSGTPTKSSENKDGSSQLDSSEHETQDETVSLSVADRADGVAVEGSGDLLEVFHLEEGKDVEWFEPEGYQYLAACGPAALPEQANIHGYLIPSERPYGKPHHAFEIVIGAGNGVFITREFLHEVDRANCRNIAVLDWPTARSTSRDLPGWGPIEVIGKVMVQFLLEIEGTGGFIEIKTKAWVTEVVLDWVAGANMWVGEQMFPAYKNVGKFQWVDTGDGSLQLVIDRRPEKDAVLKIKMR
ncbi:hypothetical protein B0A52_10311 [Exophiala mesophila]|uniref:Uncharacterized protein n=1 Tax=Exophiala mesophila TaxID=212818 RepID=A0A438MQA1_EXOME|nr:hypothetical protein B0A52_10311 [Exophiala mesophila]